MDWPDFWWIEVTVERPEIAIAQKVFFSTPMKVLLTILLRLGNATASQKKQMEELLSLFSCSSICIN